MVIKHIEMIHEDRSSMVRLVGYITDTQGKDSRVGEVFITNCLSDAPDMAALEMLATQDANTASAADKTYHALVSFPIGELPTPEAFREIETAICDRLKMGEHQRVAVVHHDTSCVHMHIAVNKIHPETHTIREPYQDHIILGKLAEQLEKKYDLERTNHSPTGKTAGQRNALDIEAMTGQQSLLSWVREECLNDLLNADSWDRLHEIAGTFGLSVKLRGNGLVFTDRGGTSVKGSDVGADFKKSALEKRFGAFVPASSNPEPMKSYDKQPLGGSTELRREFNEYRAAIDTTRAARFAAINAEFARKAAAIRETQKKERLDARRLPVGRMKKRALYKAVRDRCQCRMALLREQSAQSRDAARSESPKLSWLSWLQSQAAAGRDDAIKALRSRGYAQAKKRTADISGDAGNGSGTVVDMPGVKLDAVTKQGIVLYSVGADAIRDDGHAFRVSRNAAGDTDIMALKLAMRRYGRKLRIHGDRDFQERMLNAAVKGRLYISFADEDLEARRRRMMRENSQKSKVTTLERI